MNVRARGLRLRSLFGRRAIVLLYHRIDHLTPDPWSLAVKPKHFEEHLAVLRRHCDLLSLDELCSRLEANRIPRRAVAVTFDDGYADNLHQGKPILERYNCPATVFLTGGALGTSGEFWWDELERLILQPSSLPAELEIRVGDGVHRWQRQHGSPGDGEAYRYHHGGGATRSALTGRNALYRSLWNVLRGLVAEEREPVLRALVAWVGGESSPRRSYRALSVEETVALVGDGLVRAGAHTWSHPALARLPVARQREEIVRSKSFLEDIVGGPVTSFSYPFGTVGDYTAETASLVREVGFASACSNFPGVITRSVDRYQLPRLYVEDWDGEQFAEVLFRAFAGRHKR